MYGVARVQVLSALGLLASFGVSSSAWAQAADATDPTAAEPVATAPAARAPAAEAAPVTPAKDPEAATAFGIFFNPLSIAFGQYGLELDVSPMRMLSINVSGFYYSRSIGAGGFEVKTSAWGGDVGVQIFFTGHKPMHGFYLYPRVAYAKAQASETGFTEAKASLLGFGATAGYQWNWQPFSFRLGGGVMYYTIAAQATNGPEIALAGTAPALDLTLGFVF